MKKTIHDTPVDNTQTMNKGDDRIDASRPSRRKAIKTLAATTALAATASSMPLFGRYGQVQSSEPIKIGFQVHRTGIGAAYGRWYDRTTKAAVKKINDEGGINGRQVEIVAEDDGTDPKRGAEVVEKMATQHGCDIAFGTLFSHVVIGSAPRAGELKIPYFVVSEGHHVASGMLNRYTLQPGITDVKSQVQAMAPFVNSTLGKKVTMIYPDFAFGHDHRDYFSAAVEAQGGEVVAKIAIPPTESSFTKYFPKIPRNTDVIYHVMVGPAVLTFVKEMGEFFGNSRPEIFGFIDSLEAVDLASPGLEFLEGTYFWEGNPRYAQANQSEYDKAYRAAVGVDANGASLSDSQGRGHLRPYVRLLGDAPHRQGRHGSQRLCGRRRQVKTDRGRRIDDLDASFLRASARCQGIQRQDPPDLRPPVHHQGDQRQAGASAHHIDRGYLLSRRGRLHHTVLLGRWRGLHSRATPLP